MLLCLASDVVVSLMSVWCSRVSSHSNLSDQLSQGHCQALVDMGGANWDVNGCLCGIFSDLRSVSCSLGEEARLKPPCEK